MNKKKLISPFSPSNIMQLPEVNGVRHSTCRSGIKDSELDLAIVIFDKLANVAGVFTNSETSSLVLILPLPKNNFPFKGFSKMNNKTDESKEMIIPFKIVNIWSCDHFFFLIGSSINL